MKNKEFQDITISEKVERKTMYKSKKNLVIKSLLFSTVLGGSLLLSNTSAFADENDGVWIARTAEQIKAEISGNEYLIKWGDTLSAISEATNISVNRLAEINEIENVDLIFAMHLELPNAMLLWRAKRNTISYNGGMTNE